MFNLSTQEAETRGRLQVQGQLCFVVAFRQAKKQSWLKKKKKTTQKPKQTSKNQNNPPKTKTSSKT